MSSGSDTVTRSFEASGVDAYVVDVGFKPRKIEVYNVTDPGFMVWVEGMADDSGLKQVDGTSTHVTSNGITPTATGFLLGLDTDMNVDGEVLHVVAYK